MPFTSVQGNAAICFVFLNQSVFLTEPDIGVADVDSWLLYRYQCEIIELHCLAVLGL
jgi:hypothetical protein